MRTVRLYFDPKFNEWLYDVLTGLTAEQKSVLNARELAWIKNKTNIKRFVNNAPIERIEILLTKVGIECSRIFYFRNNFDAKVVKGAYRQYSMKDKRVEEIEKMVKNKMFVTHSKDIAMALAMMSMNCHSALYYLNSEFLRVGTAIGEVGKKREIMSATNNNRVFLESNDAFKRLGQLLVQTLDMEAYLGGRYDLRKSDLMIMLILLQHDHTYVSVEVLKSKLAHMYRPGVVGVRSGRLFRLKYLDKLPAERKVLSYCITQKGILLVGDVLNHIVNQQV